VKTKNVLWRLILRFSDLPDNNRVSSNDVIFFSQSSNPIWMSNKNNPKKAWKYVIFIFKATDNLQKFITFFFNVSNFLIRQVLSSFECLRNAQSYEFVKISHFLCNKPKWRKEGDGRKPSIVTCAPSSWDVSWAGFPKNEWANCERIIVGNRQRKSKKGRFEWTGQWKSIPEFFNPCGENDHIVVQYNFAKIGWAKRR